MDQWIDKIRNDPETQRRLYPAFLPWNSPRFVLRRLNEWSPMCWDWYWYRGWGWADEIPEEYLSRILEEEDI